MRSQIRKRGVVLALSLSFSALGFWGGAARAADKLSISLPAGQLGATVPLFIGVGKGYFAEEGIDPSIVGVDTPALINAAVISGGADIGGGALIASFYNVAGNGDLKIIAGDSAEAPGFRGQTVVTTTANYNKGLKSPADLTGKSIAVGTKGSAHEYDLYLLAQKYHFTFDRNKLVALNSYPNSLAALKAGSVDAAVLNSPLALAAESSGDGKILAWVGDEVPWEQGAILATPKTISTRRDLLTRFMRGYLKACAVYAAAFEQKDAQGKIIRGPGADDLIQVLATATKTPAALIAQSLPFIEPKGNVNRADILQQLKFWQDSGEVPKTVSGANFIDTSILDSVSK